MSQRKQQEEQEEETAKEEEQERVVGIEPEQEREVTGEEEQEPQSLSPLESQRQEQVIARSLPLNMLIQSLAHGAARSAQGGFPPHPGMVSAMKQAYEHGDATRFLCVLQQYVTQAQGRVAGFLTRGYYQEQVLPEIQRLHEEEGVSTTLVFRRILSFQNIR